MTPAPAFAGAWIAPEGGQQIWTSVAGERQGFTFFESSGYVEAPLGRHTSVVVAPWLEQSYETVDGWRAEASVGVKRVLFRRDENVVALQAGAIWTSHPADDDCSETGGEVRLLAGRAFGQRAFANVEASSRAYEGGCQGERLDLTLGYRPRENLLTLAQLFVDAPDDGEESIRAQLTLVYFRRNGRGIQVGLRTRVDDGPAEAALVIGLWSRTVD